MQIPDNTPLGITQIYNRSTNTTEVSFSYIEDADIQYFVLEVWDDTLRKWVPYDKLYGVLEKK